MGKLHQIYGRDIVSIGDTHTDAKNSGPCPVCKALRLKEDHIARGESVIKVMLDGRSRATWIHTECAISIEVPENVHADKAVEEITLPAIKESPSSLDGVISEIAKMEGRKAAYEAVMDIGPAELHVHQGENTAVVKGAKHKEFERAVKLSVNREPIFLIGATGSGKSLLYMQPASLNTGGTVLVVTPLCALAAEQRGCARAA